jgi:hypothetical protein
MDKTSIDAISIRILRDAKEIRYGTVSALLKIHDGGIVEVTYAVTEQTRERRVKP